MKAKYVKEYFLSKEMSDECLAIILLMLMLMDDEKDLSDEELKKVCEENNMNFEEIKKFDKE